jgi:glycerol uptake facilitator-like aquaporin
MIRRLAAEALGTGLLIVAVIGSGIMATNLTDDVALPLILIFAPVSGASFNPAVGIVSALLGEVSWKQTALYAVAQTVGGCLGAMTANVMFEHPIVELSTKVRDGSNIYVSEVVATVGLLLVIWGTIRANRSNLVPFTVAAWITGAYFFTSSTSLANPAVSIARSLSNSFAGIDPNSVPAFIAMQIIGAFVGYSIIRWLFLQEAKS